MSGIGERIQWVLDSDRVASASAWCVKAGLPRTYISAFMFRERQGQTSDMGVNTAVALARAAGVHPAWFVLGAGEPDELNALLPPNLARLLASLTTDAFPDKMVKQALLLLDVIGEKDLPEDVWRDYLDALRKEARRVGLELAAARLTDRGLKR